MSMLSECLAPGRKVHMVGIGGVSMCALAEELCDKGLIVSGSDMQNGPAVEMLRSKGVEVKIGHAGENIGEAEFLICTAAVHDDNPEIIAAKERMLPIFGRAEAWGEIMANYKNAICVAGTHGKTTTTSMCTHIAMKAGSDPTVMIGGYLPLLGSGHRTGKGDTIIMESCEYCNSFLHFSPTVAVICNIEADHLDFFKDLEDIKSSFRRFAALVPKTRGAVVVNMDDKNAMDAVSGLDRNIVTFGFNPDADICGRNYDGESFDIWREGRFFCHVKLSVRGAYNASNALAAAAACIMTGAEPADIEEGLAEFGGAGRRFEHKGVYNGAQVYDDYAHHPGEVTSLLNMARELKAKRVVCVFQPHTYTRTKALFDEFVRALSLADETVLAEIYAAREKNTVGISSADLAEKIPDAKYFPTFGEITEYLRRTAGPGDIIITVGAGDIFKVGESLLA
ncbi:MAG: UDP-N-acetylmuramate--L-alanine ligase [Oscillospiraceae bacterium]|nr:UDP-N-acetylmuramate--L-alanine ligase [Oscillospiraceae bacterium]